MGNVTTCVMGDVSACAADMAAMDQALSNMAVVSAECQKLLVDSKTISCLDYTTADCYIKGLSAWDTKLGNTAPTALLIPKMNATGTFICKRRELALLVNTNFVVGKVSSCRSGTPRASPFP
jgi:hypothetical protein